MPRYIDADIEVSDYVTVWDCDCSEFGRQTVMAVDDLEYLPTSDVVPKSEYDAVVSAVDNSTKEFLKLHDAYQNQKSDYDKLRSLITHKEEQAYNKGFEDAARELFEEIENIAILNDYLSVKDFYTEHPLIAELKKKYTEGAERGTE